MGERIPSLPSDDEHKQPTPKSGEAKIPRSLRTAFSRPQQIHVRSPGDAEHSGNSRIVEAMQVQMRRRHQVPIDGMAVIESQQYELSNLRDSHASMACRLHRLEEDMRCSRRLLDAERMAIIAHLQVNDVSSVGRTVLFSAIRASKVLQSTSTELGRRVLHVTEADSIVPFVLKSPGSDCTLLEFQTMALKLLSEASIPCRALPSEYHIRFPNIRHCARMSIAFDTYAGLCEALQLDTATREAAVYREKGNNARQIRAIQVLGSHVKDSSSRSILLGRRIPTTPAEGKVPTLYQDSVVWSEDPGTWESEFRFLEQPISALCSRNSCSTDDSIRNGAKEPAANAKNPLSCVARGKRTRDMTNTHQCFALSWERLQGTHTSTATLNEVSGTINSIFPAVVVRTSMLLRSTSKFFKGHGIDVDLTALLTTQKIQN